MGIEYALRAFPVGGYVAFPANVEYDESSGDELRVLDDPDLLQNRPVLQRYSPNLLQLHVFYSSAFLFKPTCDSF